MKPQRVDPRSGWRTRLRSRRRTSGAAQSNTAAVIHRLAVLLAAGVTPAAAWGYLDEAQPVGAIAALVRSGVSVPDALALAADAMDATDRDAWRSLAAAWTIAAEVGAPLAPTLLALAQSQRDVSQSARDVAVALAGPVATARLVLALPPVGVLFGYALGFDTVGTLTTKPLGWACLAIGGGLLAAAALWNRRLVRIASGRDVSPGLALDLAAIALAGGGSPAAAQASVERVMARFEFESSSRAGISGVLELSRRAGVPAAGLLRGEADEQRRIARTEGQLKAQRLAVRLMVPLGLCVLPAFMVLGVVPLLLAVVAQTSFGS